VRTKQEHFLMAGREFARNNPIGCGARHETCGQIDDRILA
jgi:hypothetical protein